LILLIVWPVLIFRTLVAFVHRVIESVVVLLIRRAISMVEPMEF